MKNGRDRSAFRVGIVVVAMLSALALTRISPGLGAGSSSPSPDLLAAEIERWSAFLRSDAASRGIWPGLKQENQPLLARAAQDLVKGRRLLALRRLTVARVSLASGEYLSARPADQHKNQARFEAEWTRMGKMLGGALGPPSPTALADVKPAALRALGVLVEFWATWCPPCRGTLSWLGELKKRYGDRIAVVTIAVESEEAEIRQRAAELKLPFTWVKSTPEIGRASVTSAPCRRS